MRKLPLLLPTLALMAIGGDCHHRPDEWFALEKCAITHTTTKGIQWHAYGPTANIGSGITGNLPDDLRYSDVQGISDDIDAAVDTVAQQYPAVAVWPRALGLEWGIVDDYAFPDGGAVDSTTGYASGETLFINNVATMVVFALWSRHNLAVGIPEPDPSTIPAPWCLRGPGVNGYNYWRYGDFPMTPAVGYEMRVNVLHVAIQKAITAAPKSAQNGRVLSVTSAEDAP